jgi:hypothetical protein
VLCVTSPSSLVHLVLSALSMLLVYLTAFQFLLQLQQQLHHHHHNIIVVVVVAPLPPSPSSPPPPSSSSSSSSPPASQSPLVATVDCHCCTRGVSSQRTNAKVANMETLDLGPTWLSYPQDHHHPYHHHHHPKHCLLTYTTVGAAGALPVKEQCQGWRPGREWTWIPT